MATIIQLRNDRHASDTAVDRRVSGLLVGSVLVALVVVLGTSAPALAVVGLFALGMLLVHLEQRPLRPVEFAAISALHGVAILLVAF